MVGQSETASAFQKKSECAVCVLLSLCVSPISRARRVSEEVARKASSLQERVTAPTSSELVAKIRALSSDKLTPAMEATSLISSSSLDEMKTDERHSNTNTIHFFFSDTDISSLSVYVYSK